MSVFLVCGANLLAKVTGLSDRRVESHVGFEIFRAVLIVWNRAQCNPSEVNLQRTTKIWKIDEFCVADQGHNCFFVKRMP